jgi:L-iditol 2-dehydrogenase
LVVVGQYTDLGDIAVNPHWDINRKHLEIRGCWGSDVSHVYRGVKVLSRYGDRFGWEKMISRVYTLDEAPQALADVQAMKVVKALIKP